MFYLLNEWGKNCPRNFRIPFLSRRCGRHSPDNRHSGKYRQYSLRSCTANLHPDIFLRGLVCYGTRSGADLFVNWITLSFAILLLIVVQYSISGYS